MTECTLTVKSAPKTTTAVVPRTEPMIVHKIEHEDIRRDTLEVEEQKTVTDKEVTVIKKVFLFFVLIFNDN